MKTIKILLILFAIVFTFTFCEKDDPIPPYEPGEDQAPALTQKVNEFIKEVMEDVYLWADNVPEIDTKYEFDSEAYFDKLLYEEDKWSFLTDDVAALEGSFEGVEKSYGWSLAFGRFSNTGNIFALVEFVYPNTPAAEAGMERGDFIIEMFGGDITDDNYLDLLNGDDLTITLGVIGENGVSPGSTLSLTAEELTLNPVVQTEIIEHGGMKIGYLFYAQYIGNFNESLDTAFQHFVDEQVDDVVIDLRYNPGGGTTAAQHLCSSVAPLEAVNNNATLVTFQWNNKYQTYWQDQNVPQQLKIQFIDDVPVKMGLSRLYVLTGQGTASASELTITGLKPYLPVTTIGETTYGKYTASITFKPEDVYSSESYYEDFENWGLQPIVLRYANVQGVTDFKEGFSPDIEVADELFEAIPLGNKEEQLLKAALEEITGEEVIAIAEKSSKIIPEYNLFDRGFSKFDKNKREVVVDHLKKEFMK